MVNMKKHGLKRLLALLLCGTEAINLLGLRLRHGLNDLMHLIEALIVRFLTFANNAHHAIKPTGTFIAALGGQLDHLCFKRFGEHRRLTLLVIEGHHRCTLL